MGWKHIDTGRRNAAANMALDAALLSDLKDEEDAILHLYDWEGDAATYGHFIDPEKFLNMEGVSKSALDLAKRPTGGGIIFHNCDLAFSVLVPAAHPGFSTNPLENYAFVNRRVVWAIGQMVNLAADLLPEEPEPLDLYCKSFCMAKPTKYDVMIQGKKVGGAAQRKTRDGYLHQGSIALGSLPESYLREVLAPQTRVFEGMQANSFALLGEDWTQNQLNEARGELRAHLQKAFTDRFA
ncbi:MAG: lipoate--protein ligase family protein [Chlamydiales bacterium]|nr:lipoate--protein ligase family protein [Chlamydiales bacterium]